MESVLRRKPQDTSREHIHLSPRMWGTCWIIIRMHPVHTVHPHGCGEHLVSDIVTDVRQRFIPTNVGNMVSLYSRLSCCSVHPHECGEHVPWTDIIGYWFGSSPRMWGTLAVSGCRTVSDAVHPHECGEHLSRQRFPNSCGGSSPRMWGTFHEGKLWPDSLRFIPTDVGNMLPFHSASTQCTVHPHECGEHSSLLPQSGHTIGSSPRMWGTLL